MRVAVIATGMMELLGLRECLGRLFPRHTFDVVPRIAGYGERRAEPFAQAFTARHDGTANDMPSNLTKLVQELAGQVYPRRRDAADLAVVVDDLELFNLDQPEVAVAAVRDAARKHVAEVRLPEAERQALARCLREHASFHFAVPMTESWFFGAPASLARNGVPAGRQSLLRAGVDPESFETADQDYSADDGGACTTMADRNRRRKENRRPPWILAPQPDVPWFTRERHPKAYLQWLCRAPGENWCTAWKESDAGKRALQALDWAAVLSNPAHCTYARALVDDIADALGEAAPFPADGTSAPLTARKHRALDAVLRNL